MLFIKTKHEGGNIIIYRDGKPLGWLAISFSLLFIFPAILLPNKIEMLGIVAFVTFGTGCMLFGIWRLFHGAIVINKARRQIEFRNDPNLQTPSGKFPFDSIERVFLKSYVIGGFAANQTNYTISLTSKSNIRDSNELRLYFSNRDKCRQAAKLIAESAQIPAYDADGRQFFPPR